MPIKVLMFGWEFPPHNSGGLGTACLGLTKALNSKGIEITFVLPQHLDIAHKGVKFLFADSNKSKVSVREIDSPLTAYMDSNGYIENASLEVNKIYGKSLFEEVSRYGIEAVSMIEDGDFDIIHAHDWMSFPAGIHAKDRLNKPLIVHIHSTIIDRTGGKQDTDSEVYRIEKEGMEKADQIIAVSQFTKNNIIKYYGISPEKIRVVHNGINLDDSIPTIAADPTSMNHLKESGYRVVLFVGRLTIQKGVDYFLRAAKKVLEFNPKVIFIIVGSGDMQRQIIMETASLNLSDKVLFAGFLRGDDLKKMYKLADLFVMPSISEPFGITALESVVSGVPVILSKQSGVKEVLNHALIVDFWDIDEMANMMLAVLNYESLSLTLKNHAFEQIKSVNWESAADKCINIYKNVLNNFFNKI